MNYALGTFDGHVLVALPEGRFPVDTGSPLSFARAGRATFASFAVLVARGRLAIAPFGDGA